MSLSLDLRNPQATADADCDSTEAMRVCVRASVAASAVLTVRNDRCCDCRRHTFITRTIVSSQLRLLLATPSSSICMPDFLESAIQVSCTYARQLQLKPFLLGSNRCRPTRDCHNCAPPWLHLLHGATPKDDARLYTIAPQMWQLLSSENARVASWVREQLLNPFLLDPRRNRCQE